MKERELRAHSDCSLCGNKIGHTGLPLFWRLTVERFGIDVNAVRRQDGLTAVLGGHVAIAQAMGPDDDMATPLMEPLTLTVCESCACHSGLPVAALAEYRPQHKEEQTKP